MGIGALNSSFQKKGHVTADMEAHWEEAQLIRKIFAVEAAMARTQGHMGIIPQEAAEAISDNAVASDELIEKAQSGGVGNLSVAVLDALRDAIPEDQRGWVHFGATTQDILDTARALQIKAATDLILERLNAVIAATANLAHEHARTLMVARTNGQYALPTTLGTRFARWNAELRRSRERLEAMRERTEQIQFTGAVGTLASFGEQGPELSRRLAKELELVYQPVSWHASSDTMTELASTVATLGQSLAKIAEDLFAMQQSDLVEAREDMDAHTSGSSTMPQKLNPFATMKISVGASMACGMAANMLTQAPATFERDHRQSEIHRNLIPQIFVAVDGALEKLDQLFPRLRFDAQALEDNVKSAGVSLMTEGIMMELAPHIGHSAAHDVLQEFARDNRENGTCLEEFCAAHPKLAGLTEKLDLESLTNPANYIGQAVEIAESAQE